MPAISLKKLDNGNFVLEGDLSFATVPSLWREGMQQFANAPELTMDLSGIRRSDSAGLTLLIEWLRFANNANKQITYLNMPQQMLAIARVSGLDNILPLVNK
jgi:phospholipid transport system transporter-binding protein